MEVLLALLGLFLVFGPWIFIAVAFGRTRHIRSEVAALRTQVSTLQERLNATPDVTAFPLDREFPEAPSVEEGAEEEHEVPSDEEAVADGTPRTEGETVPAFEPPPRATAEKSPPKEPSGQAAVGFEETLASRWLVWLGAVAICLAGIFFTAYAIDQGWLGPTTRIVLGFVFGFALVIAGEWIRRRPLQRSIAAIRPDYVPLALSSAGVFAMYASIYVGSAVYSLYSPLVAFFALAAVGLCAVALALLQGWFVALLGVLGSFLTPALVPSDAPSVWTLFPYLIAVLVACMTVVRYRAWWSLAYASLAFTAGWTLFWLLSEYSTSDAPAVGTFIIAVAVAFQLVRKGYGRTEMPTSLPAAVSVLHPWELVGWAGLIAGGFLLFALVRVDNYRTESLVALAVFALGSLYVARRERAFDLAAVLASALVLVLFALWHLPSLTGVQTALEFSDIVLNAHRGPVLPPELHTYATAAVIFGGIFGIGGFVTQWGASRAPIFAGTSAAVPVLMFAIAYWRFLDFGLDLSWGAVALALAFVNLLATGSIEKYREREPLRIATGLYAASVVACISLGLAMTLKEAWLTVALSLQLPALAWVRQRLEVPLLRTVATLLALVVLVRLVLNPNIFGYPLDSDSLFSWVLYGYAIPCGAFFWSAHAFSKDTRDLLISLLEVGALVCGVLLISFEIRVLVTGTLDGPYDSFLEQSLQSIAWLAIGYGVLVRSEQIQAGRIPVFAAGAYVLLLMATVQVLALQVLFNNPTRSLSHISVGQWPVFNLLLLGYLVPAGFAFSLVPTFTSRNKKVLANLAGAIGLFLLLVYVSLEVKHWFQGQNLSLAFDSDAENYAISLTWLVYALALLGCAILFRIRALRYGSLAILLITALKVFVFDMSGLIGLYRVASFLGLGLCLVGIGYIYQRYVFRDTMKATSGGGR